MTYKYNFNKLNGRIIEKFESKKNFAMAIGLSEKSMSDKINCKRYWKQPEISKACELLQIPSDEIGEYFFKHCVQDIEHN